MDTSNQRPYSIGLTNPNFSVAAQTKPTHNNSTSSQHDQPNRKKFSGMPHGSSVDDSSRNRLHIEAVEDWQSSERFADASVGRPRYTGSFGAKPPVYKVFLKGLNKSTTKDTVMSVLRGFGKITYLRMPFSSRMNRNLGYCVVIFELTSVGRHLVEQVRSLEIDGSKVVLSQFRKIQKNYYSAGTKVSLQEQNQPEKSRSEKTVGGKEPFIDSPSSSAEVSIHPSKRDLEISLHCRKPTQRNYHSTVFSQSRDFAHSSSNLLLRVRWVLLKPSIL